MKQKHICIINNILKSLLFHCGKKISDIMDKIDAVKLLSSMTLFMIADEYNICNNKFLNEKNILQW